MTSATTRANSMHKGCRCAQLYKDLQAHKDNAHKGFQAELKAVEEKHRMETRRLLEREKRKLEIKHASSVQKMSTTIKNLLEKSERDEADQRELHEKMLVVQRVADEQARQKLEEFEVIRKSEKEILERKLQERLEEFERKKDEERNKLETKSRNAVLESQKDVLKQLGISVELTDGEINYCKLCYNEYIRYVPELETDPDRKEDKGLLRCMLDPCGHMYTCLECATNLWQKKTVKAKGKKPSAECPWCKRKISSKPIPFKAYA
ncbi:hypothetical protein CYMTET_36837 [Cymbomonas tetramitiformis]|uniref:RING-type domain-containing protein n=1 Tax=Cymbomonas tetramitiformis TaxID=36881 RepID=A0AAE0CGP7_9CHLO|nr:hypothetical protein CYMTET_36837 [Cymbomonas tetramitiformis]